MASKNAAEKFNQAYASHHKIWNKVDFDFLKPIFK